MMVLWREIRGLLRVGLRKRERGRQGEKGSGIPRGGTMGEQPPSESLFCYLLFFFSSSCIFMARTFNGRPNKVMKPSAS